MEARFTRAPRSACPPSASSGPRSPRSGFRTARATDISFSAAISGAVPAIGTSARGWTVSIGSGSGTRSRRSDARSRTEGERVRAREDLAWVRRVLVLRHRAAGDLLLTTPALRALRAGLPSAKIDVLVSRGVGALLGANPDVDRVIEIDRSSVVSQLRQYTKLLAGRYDLVLDMVSNPRSAFMTALTRASIRVGFDIPGRSWAYTVRVPRDPVGPG